MLGIRLVSFCVFVVIVVACARAVDVGMDAGMRGDRDVEGADGGDETGEFRPAPSCSQRPQSSCAAQLTPPTHQSPLSDTAPNLRSKSHFSPHC